MACGHHFEPSQCSPPSGALDDAASPADEQRAGAAVEVHDIRGHLSHLLRSGRGASGPAYQTSLSFFRDRSWYVFLSAAQAVRAWAALEGLCCFAGGWRLMADGGAVGTARACNRLMTHRRCACRPCVQMLTCGCHEPLNSRICDTLPRYTCAQGQGGEGASGSPRAADGIATACAKPEPSSPACGGAGRAAAQSVLMLLQASGRHCSLKAGRLFKRSC